LLLGLVVLVGLLRLMQQQKVLTVVTQQLLD
jgi:hypothetical protein